MRSIVAIELPAMTPAADPDVVRETRTKTDRRLMNAAVHIDGDSTACYDGHENDVNNADQDNGEPINMTLGVKSTMIKDGPVAVSEDETNIDQGHAEANVEENKDNDQKETAKAPEASANKETDASDSEYYNVTFYDNLNRKGKNKSKGTNIDQEYAEINVRENKGNEKVKSSMIKDDDVAVTGEIDETGNREHVNVVNIADKKERPRLAVSNQDQDNGEPIHVTLEEVRSGKIKDDPVAVTDDNMRRKDKNKSKDTNIDHEYAEVNFEENKDNDQKDGEPIHVTLEEVKSSKIKDDPRAVTDDNMRRKDKNKSKDTNIDHEYAEVNFEENKDNDQKDTAKAPDVSANKDTDASNSKYYNVTFYDNLNRKGKNKSKGTNIDQEYAEINVGENKGNEQKKTAEAPEARPRLPDSNKDTDASNSENYNVNHYDNLNRKGKNKSKDTNIDHEYAEVNVEENKDSDQKETAKALEASANVEVEYAAIDKDRKRKKGGDSSKTNFNVNVKKNKGNEQVKSSKIKDDAVAVTDEIGETGNKEHVNVNIVDKKETPRLPVSNQDQDNGEPIKNSKMKDDPVAATEDEAENREHVHVNIADKKDRPTLSVPNKDTDVSKSDCYNLNHDDNLKRKDDDKSEDTNIDLEYAEIYVRANKGNEQKENPKAPETSTNAEVEYAAIDNDRNRKKDGDSSRANVK